MKKLKLPPGRGKKGNIVTGSSTTRLKEWYAANHYLAAGAGMIGIILLAVVVPVAIYRSIAATGSTSFEPENGSTTALAVVTTDSTASGGKYIQFTAASGGGGFAWPKSVSANKRYLLDQNGQPYLVNGDAPHTIAYFRTVSEADQYFANRQGYGVNSAWVEIICDQYISCSNDRGPTVEGYSPFTGTDLSQPNPQFFTKLDQIVQSAQSHGITLFLTPVETGGWTNNLIANGTTKAFNYGVFLGNRYKNFPNIVWQHGNDYSVNADTQMMAIFDGIKSVDTNHLQVLELYPPISATLDQSQWSSRVPVNESYTYYATYNENLHAYNQTPTMPMLMVEAGYEFENAGGRPSINTPNTLRRQEYWTMTTGATGQLYGSAYTWNETNWTTEQANLDSPGIKQLQFMYDFFKVLPWYDLVPDQTHTFVTAGYGTYDSTQGGNVVNTSNYATAARTADGKVGVVYTPVAHTLTVDMTKMNGQTTAQWFDGSNNTYQTVSGSPFANTGTHQFTTPGNNSEGTGDWVLLLKSP